MQLSLIIAALVAVASAGKAPRPQRLAPAPADKLTALLPPPLLPFRLKGNGTDVFWTTQTVTAYKTFCPSPTSWVQNKKTYTATKSEWVTVTDCPNVCTISYKTGPTPTILPILPPAPKQNTTMPVKPTVFVPAKDATTTIAQTTTACPKNQNCPKSQGYNSTMPASKPSIPMGTGRPLTTVTTTNKAGQTVTSVSTKPCPTITTTNASGSTIAYVPGIPATTITTTNKAGKTATSVISEKPGKTVAVSPPAKGDNKGDSSKPTPAIQYSSGAESIAAPLAALAAVAAGAFYFL